MRISDWSSDVCSSDLATTRLHLQWSFPIMFTRVSRGGTGLQTGLSAWILAIVRALEEADVDPAPLMQGIGMDASRRSEEHTSELQSLMRISYAVFCLKKKKDNLKRNAKDCNCEIN